MKPHCLPPIETLVPHRGTMLLLDAVTAWDAESATAIARVQPDGWYASETGEMPSWIGIELMAQTIAAHVALTALSEGREPKRGILLGTRVYQATMTNFPAGKLLNVKSTLIYRDASGLGAYDSTITLNDEAVATAIIKVFEPDDFKAFLESTSIQP